MAVSTNWGVLFAGVLISRAPLLFGICIRASDSENSQVVRKVNSSTTEGRPGDELAHPQYRRPCTLLAL